MACNHLSIYCDVINIVVFVKCRVFRLQTTSVCSKNGDAISGTHQRRWILRKLVDEVVRDKGCVSLTPQPSPVEAVDLYRASFSSLTQTPVLKREGVLD